MFFSIIHVWNSARKSSAKFMNVVILSYEIHKVTHTPHVMALLVLTEQEYNVTLETECVCQAVTYARGCDFSLVTCQIALVALFSL